MRHGKIYERGSCCHIFSVFRFVRRQTMPALVLADWDAADVILCQITSKTKADGFEVALEHSDFENGSLPVPSHIRPNKIFTADKSIILSKAGKILTSKFHEVGAVIVKLIS